MKRIEGIDSLNKQRIADAIEGTRFPPVKDQKLHEEASILRAADFIGQLGDPNYIRKANALFHEFEEVGMNRQLGMNHPPTSSIATRNFIGTVWRPIFRQKYGIST